MGELVIESGIVIDDIDSVIAGIEEISGKKISDAATIKKFITQEKATKFYIDSKCSCRMLPDKDTVYLWLDSGYTDSKGNPIMISLLNSAGKFTGHYFGSMSVLAKSIRNHFPRNIKDINKNLGGLRGKYEHKIKDRKHAHIYDENEYLLSLCNGDEENSVMSKLLEGMADLYPAEPEAEEVVEEEIVEEMAYDMNFREKEITVGLLLDTIDDMQSYIDELLAEIEKFNSEDRVRILELEAKNEEYKRALVQMRSYMDTESKEDVSSDVEGFGGHELLGRNGKILVLGALALDMNTVNGIAKLYGFQKKDFQFETDYTKIKNFTGRMSNGEKYSAVILGACPHKVGNLGDWSSVIAKCKASEDMTCVVDARSYSGELKVTKESLKRALAEVCGELRK